MINKNNDLPSFVNETNLPNIVDKLSNASNIKITGNKYGNRVQTVIDKIVEKADDITKAIEQEVINDSYSFKVGTGDVDVSTDVEDGFGEVGIKGVTYQNILGTRINTSDGVEKSNNIITFNKVAQTNCTAGFLDSLAQVDKTYTLIFDILENTIENPTNGNVGKINIVSYNSGNYFIKYKETGHKKILLKQPATSTGKPYVEFYNSTSGKFVMTTPILLEGNHLDNPSIPSKISNIVGVGDKSKNLFDSGLKLGNISWETGVENNLQQHVMSAEYIKVRPNTKYIIHSNTSHKLNLYFYDNSKVISTLSLEGVAISFTTNSTTEYIKVLSVNNTDLSNSRFQLEEGDVATSYEPYHDGYKIEILSHGKNLFNNKNNFITGGSGFAQTVGQMVTLSNIGDSNNKYLRVKLPIGKKYTVTIDKRNTYPDGWSNTIIESISDNIIVGSTYKTIARNNNSSSQISMLTFETSMPYVFIHIGRRNVETYEEWFAKVLESFETLQIEENDTSSEFEPYQEDKTQILLDEPLMRLPNGVCDEITRDGKLIRRVGKVVLEGSEDEQYSIENFGNGILLFKLTQSHDYSKNRLICNTFPAFSTSQYGRDFEACYWVKGLKFMIKESKLSTQNTSGFKQWLSQNPTTVYYELAEPIITELPAPYLRIFKDGHLTFNTLVAPESNHVVQLNKSEQIQNAIKESQSLNNRINVLENNYDNLMLSTISRLNDLELDYTLK